MSKQTISRVIASAELLWNFVLVYPQALWPSYEYLHKSEWRDWFALVFQAHSGEQGGTDIYLCDGLLRAAVVEQELLSEGSDRSK